MNRDDDTRLDDALREFLRQRAADTASVPDASAMSAAIAVRMPKHGVSARAWTGRFVLVAILASLALLAAGTFLVGAPRPPALPLSLGNGVIEAVVILERVA